MWLQLATAGDRVHPDALGRVQHPLQCPALAALPPGASGACPCLCVCACMHVCVSGCLSCLSVWLAGWMTGWMAVWLAGWLAVSGWLAGRLAGWLAEKPDPEQHNLHGPLNRDTGWTKPLAVPFSPPWPGWGFSCPHHSPWLFLLPCTAA